MREIEPSEVPYEVFFSLQILASAHAPPVQKTTTTDF